MRGKKNNVLTYAQPHNSQTATKNITSTQNQFKMDKIASTYRLLGAPFTPHLSASSTTHTRKHQK
eukprot:m.218984 g.218984  ORF g.218984 m.218984 type:complete len:65 (-) comp15608_c0_seq6:1592-1786(-)